MPEFHSETEIFSENYVVSKHINIKNKFDTHLSLFDQFFSFFDNLHSARMNQPSLLNIHLENSRKIIAQIANWIRTFVLMFSRLFVGVRLES